MAADETVEDHVDEFFVDLVLMGLARELRLVLVGLGAALAQQSLPPRSRIEELYLRLDLDLQRLHRDVRAQEVREPLPRGEQGHEPQCLHLADGARVAEGDHRRRCGPAQGRRPTSALRATAIMDVPDTTYLLTLDADSLLLRDYCLRLVYFLESAGNERVAVTQTPYSSFRGAPTRIERVAGATTDLQHILHQGMTYYGATFWVGANAVIRKRALEDIVEVETAGGFEIRTYIQDRTVIEDTESSIDLGQHGWTLVNYPERLSYSATPPDFGSLVVQRRRWANGGLLILPKLWAQLRQQQVRAPRDPVPRGAAAGELHGVHRLGELRPGLPAGVPL